MGIPGYDMKIGIVCLIIGVLLLLCSIPYSIICLIAGVNQIEEGIVSGGFAAYIGIIGVVAGFIDLKLIPQNKD